MDRVYRSKIDWWAGLLIGAGIFVLVGVGIALAVNPPPDAPRPILLATAMWLMAARMAWIVLSIRYTVTTDQLLVRATCFRWRIPLDQIIEVFPTHNPLSSPALSVDRLRVNYETPRGRKRAILISPESQGQFLDDLARAARLAREGERLMRRR